MGQPKGRGRTTAALGLLFGASGRLFVASGLLFRTCGVANLAITVDLPEGNAMAPTPDVRPVGDLPYEIGKTAARELSLNGISSLEQVAEHSKKELLAIHGVGPKAVSILADALAEKGLTYKAHEE